MFGFPVNLQDSGVQKFTNDADNGFPKIQQREVFYSVKDGDWLDKTIWQTASGRVGLLPGVNDDVYIKNIVKIQNLNPPYVDNYYCNNLFVSGILNLYNFRINVYGNFKNVGIINSGLGTGFFSELKLYGVENILGTINQNNWTSIHFARNGVQYIPSFNYYRLSTSGLGAKYLTSNTIVLENLICDDSPTTGYYINGIVNLSDDKLPIFECAGYELEVYGQTLIKQWSIFKQSGSGRLKFRGLLGVGFGLQYAGGFLLPGNPDVECQNGLYVSYDINLGYGTRGGFYSGTGTWRFTTNNQYIWTNVSSTTAITFDAPVLIAPGITLTHHNYQNANGTMMYLNNTINGESSTSKLENRGSIIFATSTSVPSMTTGIVDFTTYTNTIAYSGNYTATIPSYFPTFHNLTISGTGTKSLGVNTTLNGNLNVYGGTFELSSYNLSVNGTSTIIGGTISKTGTGNLLFVGSLDVATGGGAGLNFSGNPNVEFRNGSNIGLYPLFSFNTGTGQWKYSTNTQNMRVSNGYYTYNCSFLISGAITLNIIPASGTESGLNLTNTFDGDNALSKLVLGNVSATGVVLGLSSTTMPMATFGTFDFTTNANSVIQFMQTGSFTIPYSSFRGLYLKTTNVSTLTLSADTLVNGNLLFYGGYLQCSSYALSVNGYTEAPSNVGTGILKNSPIGSLLFVGSVVMNTNGAYTFDLSVGNPNVEFRSGFGSASVGNYPTTNIKSGTGTWTFTTNNQSVANGNNTQMTLDCNIVVSGGITLTIAMGGAATNPLIFNGVLNGNNSLSKALVNTNTIVTYRNATQPMATGILDTSTNANTWIYGNSNQDIKGGPTTGAKQVYRNLTLNGGGTKTLQGYVSVLNTYTLTSPATLNNNGFTLTNP